MRSHMLSSLKSVKSDKVDKYLNKYFNKHFVKRHKAQFFILSAFAIVALFYLISGWIEPYTIIDTSQVALMDEIFMFNNIKEKIDDAIKTSKTCEDLVYNMQEYKDFVESYVSSKGYKLIYSYLATPCLPDFLLPVYFAQINVTLQSPRATLNSQFSDSWPS